MKIQVHSQTIIRPIIDKQDQNSLKIDKIEITDFNTIIHCTHTAPKQFINGGWVRIEPNIYIKETYGSKKYYLINAEGIPLSPNKFYNSYVGQKKTFKLIFPKIDKNITYINLIECENNNNCFNFYGIKLKNNDEKYNSISNQDNSLEYKTVHICSQEYLEFNSTIELFQVKNEGGCNNCKIMFNDYYLKVFENNKELFSIDKESYYKSSEQDGTIFYHNKYNGYFMQIENNIRWMAFGKDREFKIIYNFCDSKY